MRAAHDAAARFAWHPTLAAFVVVALGTTLACWYLIHRSLEESLETYRGLRWNGTIAVAVVAIAIGAWFARPPWSLRTEVLSPILNRALGEGNSASTAVESVQRLFQTLAFLASCFVVGAASAALLTPKAHGGETEYHTRHLADQWRRLAFTRYAGAALLVTAVVHQTALLGWGTAFAKVLVESQDAGSTARIAKWDTARFELLLLQARLDTHSLVAGTAPRTGAEQTQRDAMRRKLYLSAFRVDSLARTVERDTPAAKARVARASALLTRVGESVTTAITRGGGLVYSILLAITDLLAAVVLMERARELSQVVKKWRSAQGIGFSLSSQWSKFAAVLSPVLASGGAAYLFKFLE